MKKLLLIIFFTLTFCFGLLLAWWYQNKGDGLGQIGNLPGKLTGERSVEVSSNIAAGEVEFVDNKSTIDRLDQIDYWSSGNAYDYQTGEGGLTAHRVVVNFVEAGKGLVENPFYNQQSVQGELILEIASKFEVNGKHTITIGIANSLQNDKERLISWLDSSFWRAIYVVNKYESSNSGMNLQEQTDFVLEMKEMGVVFKLETE